MASFGGSVKLTGESEYRAALRNITQNLKEVSSEMKLVASQYDASDNSVQALTAKQNVLNDKLEQQQRRLSTLKAEYSSMSGQYSENTAKHEALVKSYNEAQAKLERIGQELGTTSPEFKAQAEVVRQLAADVDKSTKAQDSNANAMSRMRTQINNAQADVNKTKGEIAQLDTEMGKASSAADDMGKSMDGAKNDASKLDDAVEKAGRSAEGAANGGFTVLKGALANIAGNVIQSAISGIQSLAGEAIDNGDALKKFEQTMGFAGYDDSTIQTAKDNMKDYADRTVYDLGEVANTTAQLAANGIPNFEELTEAAGNLNAVAGGNSDTFGSVAMMLTQTAGAGKLTTENWNQLANAIPGASGVLQEQMLKNGAYTGNFRDAMEKGEISAEEFNQAIMDLGFADAAQEAATSTDTFEGAMGNMQAAVTDGLMQIYEAIGSENVTGFINGISDAVSQVIPPIKEAIQWFKDNLPTIAPMLAGIATALGAIMIAQKIEAMVTAFKTWKTATEGLTVAQRILNAVQLSNPIGIVIAAVAALVAGLVVLWNTNEGFRDFVIGAWETIKEGVGGVIDAIVNFFTVTVPTAIQDMLTWFQQLPGNIAAFLSEALANVVQWVTDMAANALSAGSQFLQNIVSFFTQLPGNVAGFLSTVIAQVISWVSQMASNARNAGSQFISNVVSFISGLPGQMWAYLSNALSNVWNWAGSLASAGANAASSLFSAVVDGISSLPGQMWNIGSEIVSGIWNGISSGLGWIKSMISGWVGNVTDFIKSLFGIASPSKVMRDEVGKYLAQGIGVGFADEMDSVTAQMEDAIPDPSSMVPDVVVGANGSVAYQAGGFGDYGSMVDAFKEALAGMRIVLDDEVAGRFVERTVANAIYA